MPGVKAAEEDKGSKQAGTLNKITRAILERRWLLLAISLAVAICLMPTPEGLTEKGKQALGLWSFVIVCFMTEAVPLPMTAMIIGSYQVMAGVGSFQEVPRTFMDDAVVFIMGVLMMGAMLVKYNIHNKIALYMLKISGTRIDRVVFGVVAFAPSAQVSSPSMLQSRLCCLLALAGLWWPILGVW